MSKLKRRISKTKTAKIPALQEDQVKAADIRERLTKQLEFVALIMDEATAFGLASGFDLAPSPDGKRTLVRNVHINRAL